MLKVSKLIKKFELEVSNGDVAEINRVINKPAIHRYGMELLGGAKLSKGNNNVIGWGTKESIFLSALSTDEIETMLDRVLTDKTPLIILSQGVDEKIKKEIIKSANKYKIPVAATKQHLADLAMTIGWYIVKYLAPSVNIHGSLVVVNGIGVMIIGKSGIGKSEAVLELVQKGSIFVSDDSVILKRIGTEFVGEPADLTKDFLEARGIGLIDIPKIYGLKSTKDSAQVELVIELVPSEELNKVDRLGNQNLRFEVLDSTIQQVKIPVENGRTLSALIEAAVNVYIAKKAGNDPLEIISSRRS